MIRSELLAALDRHEDNFVERKSEGVTPAELRKTLCAFANSVPEGRSAILFVGVEDSKGLIDGVTDTDKLQKRIRQACHEECYPKIDYSAEVLEKEGKRVVAVVITYSKNRPHFSGPAFVRIGSESIKASESQYEDLILSRNNKTRRLIEFRDRHVIISVRGINYHLGSNKPFSGGNHVEQLECKVEEW